MSYVNVVRGSKHKGKLRTEIKTSLNQPSRTINKKVPHLTKNHHKTNLHNKSNDTQKRNLQKTATTKTTKTKKFNENHNKKTALNIKNSKTCIEQRPRILNERVII